MKTKMIVTASVLSFIMMILFGMGNVQAAPKPTVIDFELEIELKDNSKYDLEYEIMGTVFEAEYQVPGSRTTYGEYAKAMIEPLLGKLKMTPRSNEKELEAKIISHFKIDEKSIKEFDLEVKFSNGKKIKIDH